MLANCQTQSDGSSITPSLCVCVWRPAY